MAVTTASYRIRGSDEARRTAAVPPARLRAAGPPRPAVGHVHAGAEQAWKWRDARHQSLGVPALALNRMIEQMGGADTSYPRGSYVSLTV
ncbi:MAG: hypothetical protein RLW62_22820 [Gammaproteobacteria bacterium]